MSDETLYAVKYIGCPHGESYHLYCATLIGKIMQTLSEVVRLSLSPTDGWRRRENVNINPKKTSLLAFTKNMKLSELKLASLSDLDVKRGKMSTSGVWMRN